MNEWNEMNMECGNLELKWNTIVNCCCVKNTLSALYIRKYYRYVKCDCVTVLSSCLSNV